MLIHLVYLSTAMKFFEDQELAAILDQAQQNNKLLQVTGALIYHDGNFIQVLEGQEKTVLDLFNKISKDPRHFGIIKVIQSPIESREFDGWSMMFQNVSKLPEELLKKNPILNTPLTNKELGSNPSRALMMLQAFRDNIR